MTQTLTFTVIGDQKLHCHGCAQRVATALRRLSGVQHVQASAATQQVVVRCDPNQVRAARVRAKLEQLGYELTGDSA